MAAILRAVVVDHSGLVVLFDLLVLDDSLDFILMVIVMRIDGGREIGSAGRSDIITNMLLATGSGDGTDNEKSGDNKGELHV